jgi:hypothetical protein
MAYFDIQKQWLDHELTIRKLDRWGETVFVDFERGSDDNHGKSPNSPKLTLNGAMDLCTDEYHDVVFCRGFADASGFDTVKQTIDVKGVRIIGAELGRRFPEYCGLYKGTALDGEVIEVIADDVLIAGMEFDSRWSTSTRTTNSENQVQAMLISGEGTGKGVGVQIVGCRFPAWYSKTGILVRGSGYGEVKETMFEGFSTYAGMVFESDGVNNPIQWEFENIRSYNNKYTIETISNETRYFDVNGIYARKAGTAVVYLGSYATQDAIFRKVMATNRTAAQLFAGGNGAAATVANLTSNYGITAVECYGSDGVLA